LEERISAGYTKPPIDIDAAIEKAALIISNAQSFLFTSGAGLGVDSGLPDFRGPEGFWRAYPPLRELGLSFSSMSNPVWFQKDPEFAWGFWSHRYHLYNNTPPHAGYDIMKKWGEDLNNSYFVFTSNVDGAFQKKRFPEEKIIECHGSVHYMQCANSECESFDIWPSTNFVIPSHNDQFRAVGDLPKCPNCQGLIRPNVLMFDDMGWIPLRYFDQNSNFKSFIKDIDEEHRLVIIEIGAGNYVPTVRMQGEEFLTYLSTATLIRINPGDYEYPEKHSDRCIAIPLGGLAALQRIDEALERLKSSNS